MSQLPYNFRKCRKLVTSVTNVVESCCHNDDTKEILKTSYVLGLKKENWFAGVKQLLTPEKGFQSRILRVNAPLKQP
jgi:hypothetical protein